MTRMTRTPLFEENEKFPKLLKRVKTAAKRASQSKMDGEIVRMAREQAERLAAEILADERASPKSRRKKRKKKIWFALVDTKFDAMFTRFCTSR